MNSGLFIEPKVPYDYVQDGMKIHFKKPEMNDGIATFMVFMTWVEFVDPKKNPRRIHFQFVPILCKECYEAK